MTIIRNTSILTTAAGGAYTYHWRIHGRLEIDGECLQSLETAFYETENSGTNCSGTCPSLAHWVLRKPSLWGLSGPCNPHNAVSCGHVDSLLSVATERFYFKLIRSWRYFEPSDKQESFPLYLLIATKSTYKMGSHSFSLHMNQQYLVH